MLFENRHLTAVSFVDPYLNIEWTMKGSDILARGTPGAGDFMYTMSSAIYIANLLKTKINLIFYWDHDALYQHHFEDPESIFEKIDWFYARLHKNHLLSYEHVYDFQVKKMFGSDMTHNIERTDTESGKNITKGLCSWKFKPHLYTHATLLKKVAVWRFKFNAETPNGWKIRYSNEDWDAAVDSVRSQGYDVIELDYRTPIREAFYHIQTSRFVMGYDGMWHYLARMLYKPTIITGDNNIVQMHDPQAMPFYSPAKDKNRKIGFHDFIADIDNNLHRLDANCKKYISKVDHIIEN